jgi:signal transduction histidine kinase
MVGRSGASLGAGEGFAPFPNLSGGAKVTRARALGLPVLALVAAACGLWIGLGEPTLSGLSLEAPGGHVQSVDPASLAWAAGIRPGQTVIDARDASEPGGWAVVTGDDTEQFAVRSGALGVTMRLGLLATTAALGLALAGIVAARRRRRRAELLGTFGIVAAWIPLAAIHDAVLGAMLGLVAWPLIGLWVARWRDRRVGFAVTAVAVLVNLAWLALRIAGSDELPALDGARFAATMGSAIVVGAIGLGMTARAAATRTRALRNADVVVVLAVLGVVLAIQLVASPPLIVPAIILGGSAMAYGRVRGGLRGWVDRAVFAEERERASIDSAEAERSRLSRELHDDPLQALVGVIHSLEEQPGTEHQRETLRSVAEQLRHIATNLHPPILDDLGLVPAVETLFAESGPVPVMLELDNEAGFARNERPPFDVELAAYRIIQEAATNALRHSGCQRIVVRGRISPATLAIEVTDDGLGLNEGDAEAALRRGHQGMASMRRRAEAIDAQLVHAAEPGRGTSVRLSWSR